jgi:hypothetical protein
LGGKGTFKGSCKCISLDEGDSFDEFVSFFYSTLIMLLENENTLWRRELVKVDFYGEVIALFGLDDHWLVLSFKDIIRSVLDEVFVTFDGHGQLDYCLDRFVVGSSGITEVKLDIVEVSDDLIHSRWTRWSKLLREDSLDE